MSRTSFRTHALALAVFCTLGGQRHAGATFDTPSQADTMPREKYTAETNRLRPVPFTAVHIEDDFWQPRIETNRAVTVPYCFKKCEETGRISNFAKAAGLIEGGFEGIFYNDSDVYKVIEGACYTLAQEYGEDLDHYLDELISTIASAQWEDGYLNTYYTLVKPDQRWTDLRWRHELYCAGHLFEAAVAHKQATGKRSLLDVALRFADHIDSTFGPGIRYDVPGHPEIEIGLVKLYHLTGEERYLKLAQFFIDQRGDDRHRELYGGYCQDHKPVIEQTEPTGHAVRAMYLYCGMADVAAVTGDQAYLQALDKIWRSQTERKLYITGGIGARHAGEAFGEDFELPNASAYNETCAAIGNALWHHRLNLLHGDAAYIDVLERTLYNGFLSGVSLQGDTFFYPNPLASAGNYHRSPWFDCSCCPVNVVRFLPSIAGFVYAVRDETIYTNLYIASTATFELARSPVTLTQRTKYPWVGAIEISVDPGEKRAFKLALRLPGWALGKPLPSDLYRYLDYSAADYCISINGKRAEDVRVDKGYAYIERVWSNGDVIRLDLPMLVRRVVAHENVKENRGRMALERGPIVYCLEAVDAGGIIRNLWIDPEAGFTPRHREDLLGGVTVLEGVALAREHDPAADSLRDVEKSISLVPYAVWDHREAGEMAVWLPALSELAEPIPPPSLASRSAPSASHCYSRDSLTAIIDQREPKSSDDHDLPRLTFWPHKGTREWVQLDLPCEHAIRGVEVYWFDDTGRGECRLPEHWRLLYRAAGEWNLVEVDQPLSAARDSWNRVLFPPLRTDAIRIEVQLREDYSAGLLEWRLISAEPD